MDYKIQGLDANGHFVSLELSAAGPQQAKQLGRERGIDVLAVESSRPGLAMLRRTRAAKFPLLLFNQEHSTVQAVAIFRFSGAGSVATL